MENKKIIFNEDIDSAINGYALAITFVGIGVFLLNNLNYFGNKYVSIVVLSIFSFLGIVGMLVELGKNKKIKGIEDVGLGLVFFIFWLVIYFVEQRLLLNILGFISLIIGIYGLVRGSIIIVVSLVINDESTNKLKKTIKTFFKLLPAIASFILVVCNILKIIYEIK